MPLGGRRFTARRWPSGDAETMRSNDDPCNPYNFGSRSAE
jgi:hypothetical protein